MIRLELPYPPGVNALWRNVRGKTLLSARARDYKAKVGLLARAAGLRPDRPSTRGAGPVADRGHRLSDPRHPAEGNDRAEP
jgi:hypothetical protein